MTAALQVGGERSCDIGETARLSQRRDFRRNVTNSQKSFRGFALPQIGAAL
jgi:hypothetical protein